MRKPFIAGNWKMNMTIKEGIDYISELKDLVKDANVEVGICPPATMLKDLVEAAKGTNIKIGAQNMHYADNGAFTGEIAPSMLKELNVDYVIIGHSERRMYYNETNETVNKKVLKAIEVEIDPILCVGESLELRERGEMKPFVKEQIIKAFENVNASDVSKVVVAYEPIWAIGTGKTATSDQANEMTGFVRETITTLYDQTIAATVRIQYGGSVKPANVSEIMSKSDIDGALVGGASLVADTFSKVVNF
ncbi:MAG: triose-phosphate isomerase [Bacillota bacterium]|nr:triose-phosphate isomerase [Bacillota bacterium]